MYVRAYAAMAQLLANSLAKVDIDLRSAFYGEVVLAGGNTMIDGFPERFMKEFKRVLPTDAACRILAT
jgi:actin-related protein